MSALINLADNSAVYDVAKVSALSIASQLSKRFQNQIYLKREDDQVIHSFKLRGAYQKMSSMSEEQKRQEEIRQKQTELQEQERLQKVNMFDEMASEQYNKVNQMMLKN